MKIGSIIDQIDLGNYALPVFQRGYVWNRDQVRKLMNSLYKGYPIGSLLTWSTQTDPTFIRGDSSHSPGTITLILDGQQRITTLYGIIQGRKPPFFEGDERAFTNLYFNVDSEIFEFYLANKMSSDSNWISVTELFHADVGNYVVKRPELIQHLQKLNAINNIKNYDLPIQNVDGKDKTVDVVVEIFNNVNSGGTKLSKGDLALARLCAQWPDARKELRSILTKFSNQGFSFSMDWLLRSITVYLTAQPYFSFLDSVSINDFKKSLADTEKIIGSILDQIGSRLGLDHDRVLQGRFAIPIIIELIKRSGNRLIGNQEWNKILYWYIHSFLWGRYSGSTESVMAQDLNTLNAGEGVEGLIAQLRKSRGDLHIRPEDFLAWSKGARFYPLLYLLTRVHQCLDWMSGIELKNALLGKNSSLEIHHIFPKTLLYEKGYGKSEVNTLANYTFLTKDTNLLISNQNPSDYFETIEAAYPAALKSHWVPDDKSLWEIDRYDDFVKARRRLLADAANSYLDKLYSSIDEGKLKKLVADDIKPELEETVLAGIESEEDVIIELSLWMEEMGLDSGELSYELVNEDGTQEAVLGLAWPEGIQRGFSEAVALLINEPSQVQRLAKLAGFKIFEDVKELKEYVEINYLT